MTQNENIKNIDKTRNTVIVMDDLLDETNILSRQLLYFLSYRYKINRSILFLYQENGDDRYLEEIASYNKIYKNNILQRIPLGTNCVGTCFSNKKNIVINDLPKYYTNKLSEKTSEHPCQLVLIPIHFKDKYVGVLEMTSTSILTEVQIKQIEGLAQNFCKDILKVPSEAASKSNWVKIAC